MSSAQLPRSSLYWRAWLGIVAAVLVLRCTVFFGPWSDPALEQIKHDRQWLTILALCVFLSYFPMFPLLLYARAD